MRRLLLWTTLLFVSPVFAGEDAARALHDRVLTIDTHVDIPLDFGTDAYDMMKPGPRGQQVHLPTMLSGGLDAPFFIVYVGQGDRTTSGYTKALSEAFAKFASIHKMADETHADRIGFARSASEARAIAASGRKVAFI